MTDANAREPITNRGSRVFFRSEAIIDAPRDVVWSHLTDWSTHGEWIPLTHVDVNPSDPDLFTAFSGIGPLVLEDRMRVRDSHVGDDQSTCTIDKIGPHLVGVAKMTLTPIGQDRTLVDWSEDVHVPYLPAFAAPAAARVASALFRAALMRLSKKIS